MNFCVHVFPWMYVFISLVYIPKCRIADNSMFNKLRNFHGYMLRLLHYFTFSPASYEVFSSSIYLSNFNIFYNKIRLTMQMSCLTHTFFQHYWILLQDHPSFLMYINQEIVIINIRDNVIVWARLSLRKI